MSTALDIPIVHTETVTTQKIDKILMDMRLERIEIYVGDYINDYDPEPYSTDYFVVNFDEIPDGTAKDDFIDVLVNVRAFARAKGKLGAGTDTDDI